MCCRLNIDKRELRSRGNGLFGAGEQTGSIGVVTLNMPKLAYEAVQQSKEKDKPVQDPKDALLHYIEKFMIYAKESLEVKRAVVIDNMKNGLMPYTKRYLSSWDTYFSTIGALGLNEMCLNLLGKDITTKEGIELSQDVLNFMRKKMADFQEETGNLYNLEATPAEGTSYSLALKDKKITNFEFIKLGETILKTSIYGTLIYLGADGFGLELSTISAGASAIILDMVLTAFKENRNITKR